MWRNTQRYSKKIKKPEVEVVIGIPVILVFETNSSRQGDEGPWVWLAYRAERCLFSSHIFAPCFSTFVRRVHSQTFEGGIDAPHFLASE